MLRYFTERESKARKSVKSVPPNFQDNFFKVKCAFLKSQLYSDFVFYFLNSSFCGHLELRQLSCGVCFGETKPVVSNSLNKSNSIVSCTVLKLVCWWKWEAHILCIFFCYMNSNLKPLILLLTSFFMLQCMCKKCQLQVGMSGGKSYTLDD